MSGTVVARPRRARVVCWVLAVVVLVVFSAVGTALRGATDAGTGSFQRGDQVAMIGLGILGALVILAFTRPRVVADSTHVEVRNVLGRYDLPWDVVRAVRFDRGSPWVSLELHDDDLLPVMAVQAADKEYAVGVVRQLRALLDAHRAAGVPDGPRDRDSISDDHSISDGDSVAGDDAAPRR